MTDMKQINDDIIEVLSKVKYNGDLADVGNEIGFAIGKYISDEMGYDLEDFIAGLKHGISLVDGTHG